jgi:hypothetical protein
MKDERFEARQNDYRKCKFNIMENREKTNLTLRKQKLEEIILNKRIKRNINNINNSFYSDMSTKVNPVLMKLAGQIKDVENFHIYFVIKIINTYILGTRN